MRVKKQESEGFCGRQITKVPNSHLQAERQSLRKSEANIIRLKSASCGQHNMDDI
jgi:hypothetical protein